ncbi:MAG: alpha/beta fold hydrolase BchO [Pseudomonadota bacterium]
MSAFGTKSESPLEGARMVVNSVRLRHMRWAITEKNTAQDSSVSLVLVHGAGASMHSWAPLLAALPSTVHVVAMDLPGHGESAPFMAGSYTLERTATELGYLLEHLDVMPDWVIGHSAGAAIAMQLRLQMSAATSLQVGAINPALLPFHGVAGVAFPVLARLAASAPGLGRIIAARARNPAAVRQLLRSTGSEVSEQQVAGYRALLQTSGHVRAVLAMMAGWQLENLLPAYAAANLPLWVLLGERDRAVPAARTRAALTPLSHCDVTLWQHAGHLAHEEAPQQCADWLTEIGALRRE